MKIQGYKFIAGVSVIRWVSSFEKKGTMWILGPEHRGQPVLNENEFFIYLKKHPTKNTSTSFISVQARRLKKPAMTT
jgi:hypothetical protein